jgi:hypothetical protein
MKEARRKLANFVRSTVDRAILRYDTEGVWQDRHIAQRSEPDSATDAAETDEGNDPAGE